MNAWLLELWAAPAALGFALLFNVPPRVLPACCLLAVLAHGLRSLLVLWGIDLVIATLFAALFLGFAGQWLAQRTRQISAVYAISAAIPMVPGTSMYHAVQALLHIALLKVPTEGAVLLTEAGVSAIRAVMILLSLTLGIAAPRLLWPRRPG